MKELTWKEQIKEVMDTLIPYCGTANIEPRIEDIISIVEAQQQVKVEAVVIAKPEDCKGCAYNWGSFNTQPEDSYCYMFSEFIPGCKKYTAKL